MIWLAWRQFRVQALAALAALIVLAVVLAMTGPGLAHLYASSGLGYCPQPGDCGTATATFLTAVRSDGTYPALYFLGGAVMYLLPATIGAFWGAPLVAGELEAGTFRLAWTQSVTRTRWIAVKLAVAGAAAMIAAGLASLMITWWAIPIDRAGGFPAGVTQLGLLSPPVFAARGIAPLGYAALAFVLGVAIGVIIKRTLPAMAITLALFAAVLFVMPAFIRPALVSPVRATSPVTVNLADDQMSSNGQIIIPVTNLPGAWIISNQTITPSGKLFELPAVPACQTGTQQQCDAWFATQHLRRKITYQPASRFWTLQVLETGILLAVAAALAGACTWRIRRYRP